MEGKPFALSGYSMSNVKGDRSSAMGAQFLEGSLTASLSNTVCISDPNGEWPAVQVESVRQLSEFGEIARLDTSLAVILKCILLTYFDVRCTQRMLLKMAGKTEPFPPAAHDCRIVRVDMAAFAEKVSGLAPNGGYAQFGDVAHISMSAGDAIVEYYDMRAAQFLLAAAGPTATPWKLQQATASAMAPRTPGLASLGTALPASIAVPGLSGNTGASVLGGTGAGRSPTSVTASTLPRGAKPALTPQGQGLTPLAKAALAAEEGSFGGLDNSAPVPASTAGPQERPKPADKGGNRPVRTKVTTKEFQKYDIDPEKIQRGEDGRTTVMVRNLTGQNSRKDFLVFLEKCNLHEKYTFFYMPCKEHRSVPAGFAFLNFVSSSDVHKLYVMVKSGFWREFISDPQSKAPAMSYARFQGHEELMKHFNSSAVLHEQDPEKRPIFRQEAQAKYTSSKDRYNEEGGTGATGSPKLVEQESTLYGSVPQQGPVSQGSSSLNESEAQLHAALEKGAKEIAAILMRNPVDESLGQDKRTGALAEIPEEVEAAQARYGTTSLGA